MMEKSYLKRITDIVEYNLLNRHEVQDGDKIVCAVSGGLDSVCLLYVLYHISVQHKYHIYAVHVNHGIRGKEAGRDEAFVKALCKDYGIELKVYSCDVPAVSKERKQSVEETARDLRYSFFDKAIQEFHANKIAIAHHMDDNVETFLFHLLRGSKVKGLVGIPRNRDKIVRPFLEVRREELFRLALEQGLNYVEDSSNKDIAYTRNYLRNVMIPDMCEKINAGAVEHISEVMEELYSLYESISPLISDIERDILISMTQGSFVINRKRARNYSFYLFSHALSVMMEKAGFVKKDITQRHYRAVYELCGSETGKKLMFPSDIEVRNEYDRMVFDINHRLAQVDNVFEFVNLKKGYEVEFGEYRIWLEYSQDRSKTGDILFETGFCKEIFDLGKLDPALPLSIRHRQEEDYMIIDEKGSHKKLSRIFIDNKISRCEREKLPVIAQGNRVLFVPGVRRSRDTWVSDKSKEIIVLSVKKVL